MAVKKVKIWLYDQKARGDSTYAQSEQMTGLSGKQAGSQAMPSVVIALDILPKVSVGWQPYEVSWHSALYDTVASARTMESFLVSELEQILLVHINYLE